LKSEAPAEPDAPDEASFDESAEAKLERRYGGEGRVEVDVSLFRRAEPQPDPLAPVQERLAARELFGSPERKFARLDLAGHLARRASQNTF
jgi:hypothetical protein